MMAAGVYVLCVLTSAFCAALLFQQYRRTRARLLLWSSLSFVGWALNNALVFADLVLLPEFDLGLLRVGASVIAISLILYGVIWDAA
jgi:hypothetical protein